MDTQANSRNVTIRSPKLPSSGETPWYPYYAGYSAAFVEDVLESVGATERSTVLDPWNGAGTTTSVARSRGISSSGFDANPALVVVAKGRLLTRTVTPSLRPLTDEILAEAAKLEGPLGDQSDLLNVWLTEPTAGRIRGVERSLAHLLIERDNFTRAIATAQSMSSLAALFYVALFDVVREATSAFRGTNPTWVRRPRPHEDRINLSRTQIHRAFRTAVARLQRHIDGKPELVDGEASCSIRVGLSSALDLPQASVDHVVASPPYCTRIDYVVSALPELALMGFTENEVKALRHAMIGTPTVGSRSLRSKATWGPLTRSVVRRVRGHESKASSTYYAKYYLQYLHGMESSLAELRRVVKPGGTVTLVVQDSYYKDVHVDLAAVLGEMALANGWESTARIDFPVSHNLASMHPGVRRYRSAVSATESALTLG
jgi:DNA modification methylase